MWSKSDLNHALYLNFRQWGQFKLQKPWFRWKIRSYVVPPMTSLLRDQSRAGHFVVKSCGMDAQWTLKNFSVTRSMLRRILKKKIMGCIPLCRRGFTRDWLGPGHLRPAEPGMVGNEAKYSTRLTQNYLGQKGVGRRVCFQWAHSKPDRSVFAQINIEVT